MKREPAEVVSVCGITTYPYILLSHEQEVIELLSSFRDIMRHNFETMDVDKIQERWCVQWSHRSRQSQLKYVQVLW
jgi:hypothetical protein